MKCIITMSLSLSIVLAQDTLWTRRYDTGMHEFAYSLAVDASGNSIITGAKGETYLNRLFYKGSIKRLCPKENFHAKRQNPSDGLAVKYTPDGDLVWAKTYDVGFGEYLYDVVLDNLGNIIMAGEAMEETTSLGVIIKCNPGGDTMWTRVLGIYSGAIAFYGLAIDAFNNIYVSGLLFDYMNFALDALLLKYDPDGALLWMRQFDTGYHEFGIRVAVDNNNNPVVCGAWRDSLFGSGDALLFKYTSENTFLWSHVYDFGQDEGLIDIAIIPPGDLITCGTIGINYIYDYLTLRCDSAGNLLWYRTLDCGDDDEACGIAINSSGDIFVTGQSQAVYYDFLTLRYNSDGDLRWEGRYDSGDDDYGWGIGIDSDDNILVCGSSYNGNNSDFFTIKYRPDVGISEGNNFRPMPYPLCQLEIYPNPFRNTAVIKFQIPNLNSRLKIYIYDAGGKLVKSFNPVSGIRNQVSSVIWDGRDNSSRRLPAGIYVVRLECGKYTITKKAILMR